MLRGQQVLKGKVNMAANGRNGITVTQGQTAAGILFVGNKQSNNSIQPKAVDRKISVFHAGVQGLKITG
jgi:hypothetical protein